MVEDGKNTAQPWCFAAPSITSVNDPLVFLGLLSNSYIYIGHLFKKKKNIYMFLGSIVTAF